MAPPKTDAGRVVTGLALAGCGLQFVFAAFQIITHGMPEFGEDEFWVVLVLTATPVLCAVSLLGGATLFDRDVAELRRQVRIAELRGRLARASSSAAPREPS